ncbi:MAG: DUF1566 domain-containing protein [Desulfobacterales bacterium]|nr:DUF1566 domain-containing protein [Desulfobacterales bacterium]
MNCHFKAAMAHFFFFILPVFVFAGPVPDTGQTKCYNATVEIPCPQPGEAFYGQDAQYKGPVRSYSKLGQNGVTLPDSATQAEGWIMTRDNVTGLIWEVKTNKDGTKNYANPNDADNTYNWYDSNPATNGGNPGTASSTDTEDFIGALNAANFAGFSDWQLPTIKELSTLVNSAIPNPGPTIDTTWFPSTGSGIFWSSITDAGSGYAWSVYFSDGRVNSSTKVGSLYVRAVRAGQ